MRKRNFKLKAVSFDVRDVAFLLKNYSGMIMLFSLFACGLIIGTASVKNSEYFRYVLSVFVSESNNSVKMAVNGGFFMIFTLTLNFIMGLCLVGAPFIGFLSGLEGMCFGALYSYRLFLYGYDGLGGFFLTDVLFYIAFCVIFIYSHYSAMCMSDSLKKYFCSRKGSVNLRNYLIINAAFLTFSVLLISIQIFIKSVI